MIIQIGMQNVQILRLNFRLCLQFAFLPYISKQLDEVKDNWNCHRIRQQKKGDTIAGIPEVLFKCGEIHGKST